ncbi:MAG TPA: cell envelope biogenesis protein OmpA [Cytophagales bacterium]|nr:cell envelope biogenesis protein OmpA [Cytophagales bacterium]HAA23437.1 cell envelope biogenesis protein OmpA [Cytophagales bacterium]HAP58632.1 cell envelope biogenesis protein OmpA [Cytophagales bacterium]
MASEAQKLDELKKALFHEELEKQQALIQKIDSLSKDLAEERKKNQGKQDPFVEEVVDRVAEVMPERLGPSITETLKVQIRESRHEVVDALYPILGKLIRKYVQQEIQTLSERLDEQMEKMFSWENLWEYIRVQLLGFKPSVVALRKATEPEIQEIFVIEKDSGLLIGSYSRESTVDQDLISGMLTAIKAFLEDAFSKQAEEVEVIQYESYRIQIRTFQRFYIAVVFTGIFTHEFQKKIDLLIEQFLEKALAETTQDANPQELYSDQLKSIIEVHDL